MVLDQRSGSRLEHPEPDGAVGVAVPARFLILFIIDVGELGAEGGAHRVAGFVAVFELHAGEHRQHAVSGRVDELSADDPADSLRGGGPDGAEASVFHLRFAHLDAEQHPHTGGFDQVVEQPLHDFGVDRLPGGGFAFHPHPAAEFAVDLLVDAAVEEPFAVGGRREARHQSGCGQSAERAGLLQQQNPVSPARRGQRGGHAGGAAAGNDNITLCKQRKIPFCRYHRFGLPVVFSLLISILKI